MVTRVRYWLGELWADKARLRRVAMIFGVSAVATVALVLWLTGGRYAGTDDAYVEAAKLMVTTDVPSSPSRSIRRIISAVSTGFEKSSYSLQ